LGGRKGIRPIKTEWWGADVVICLERGADLLMAQLMPLPLSVSCWPTPYAAPVGDKFDKFNLQQCRMLPLQSEKPQNHRLSNLKYRHLLDCGFGYFNL